MKEPKVRWQISGQKTTISVIQTGNHFILLEMDKSTRQTNILAETFGAPEAWSMYMDVVKDRVGKALQEVDSRPKKTDDIFTLREDSPSITNLKNPVIADLMDDYRSGHRIPFGDSLSDEQRRDFDRLVFMYLSPCTHPTVVQTMQNK